MGLSSNAVPTMTACMGEWAEAHFAEYSSSTMIIRDGIIVRAMSEGGNLRQHQDQARIARSVAVIGGSNFGAAPEELCAVSGNCSRPLGSENHHEVITHSCRGTIVRPFIG